MALVQAWACVVLSSEKRKAKSASAKIKAVKQLFFLAAINSRIFIVNCD